MVLVKPWDIIVVGAGPAGATAAYHLSKEGYRVLLLDRASFPRVKPCGGAISKKVHAYLVFPPESLEGTEVFGAEFSYEGRDRLWIETEASIAKMVHREAFDLRLVRAATAQGTVFRDDEKVLGFEEEKGGIRVITEKMAYDARYAVGADGPRGPSARFLNPRDAEPMGIALEEEVELDETVSTKRVFLDFGRFPWGYGWIFPKTGFSSVGCGAIIRREKIPIKKVYQDFRNSFGEVSGKKGTVKAHPLPYFRKTPYRRAGQRLLLVGDAARLMDPFLGEGIYYAIVSGTLAARAIHEGLMGDRNAEKLYGHALQREIIDELKNADKMANFIYPRLKLGYIALKNSTELGLLYVKVMSGEVSYKDFNQHLFHILIKTGKRQLKKVF